MVCPPPKTADLEELFRHEVFKTLKAEGKITDSVIENMINWRHSGFNVYCGDAIWPNNPEGLENLARYIIRASFSQQRMTYIPANDSSDGAKVVYESEDKDVIEKILRHLGLWKSRNHDPTAGKVSHIPEFSYDVEYSQIPPIDYWLQ